MEKVDSKLILWEPPKNKPPVSRGSGGGQCASGQGQIEQTEQRTGAEPEAREGSKILTNADGTGTFSRHPAETEIAGEGSVVPRAQVKTLSLLPLSHSLPSR